MLRFKAPHDMLSLKDIHPLTPALRAYLFAYIMTTLPRLSAAVPLLSRSDLTIKQKIEVLLSALRASAGLKSLPAACTLIVGGSTVLPWLFTRTFLYSTKTTISHNVASFHTLFAPYLVTICSFWSAWLAFTLLNKDKEWMGRHADSRTEQFRPQTEDRMRHAGKTIDLTLFVACRASDIVAIRLWSGLRNRRLQSGPAAKRIMSWVKEVADPSIFAFSSAIIMWSWFYAPERLPRAYNTWITRIAELDQRLLQALRLCRRGDFVYGDTTSANADLPSLCSELGLSTDYGDPVITVPIPCELYHCGSGESCEVHAGTRFLRSFRLAVRLYAPLQLISLLQNTSTFKSRVLNALHSIVRSSSFLASFVALFYYSVCLARTRLGPRVFSAKTITPQMWDSGLCILAGCLACGWSILLEKRSRRQEIAFFVAPRALATLFPRVYDSRCRIKEQLIFATSAAIIMSTTQSRHHSSVRGVLGNILARVLR